MKLPQEACCFNAVNKHHSARRMAEPTPGRRASTKSTWDKLGVSRPDPKNTHHHSWKSPHPCRGRQPSPSSPACCPRLATGGALPQHAPHQPRVTRVLTEIRGFLRQGASPCLYYQMNLILPSKQPWEAFYSQFPGEEIEAGHGGRGGALLKRRSASLQTSLSP